MQRLSHKEKSNLALQLWIRETSGRYIFEPTDTPKLIFIEFQTHPEGKNQVPLKNYFPYKWLFQTMETQTFRYFLV